MLSWLENRTQEAARVFMCVEIVPHLIIKFSKNLYQQSFFTSVTIGISSALQCVAEFL